MRLVVHGPSLLQDGSRMPVALAGLARRGHLLHWLGPVPGPLAEAAEVESSRRVGRGALPGLGAEAAVGGGAMPLRTALAGWRAGAQAMVLDLRVEWLDRWGWIDRWAWQSIHASGLVEDTEAERLAVDPRGLERERIGLWPAVAPSPGPDAAHPDTEVLERACERALARQRGRAPRPAVFLDRDGTLIRETGYLSDPASVELLPGAGRALRNLAEAGYPLVVVSNQSGIARGMFAAARAHAVMARLRERLRDHGVEITAIYFCPHHPDQDCPCRKPRPGMLERAAEDLGLDLAESVTIGDQRTDVDAGRAAGGRGILVRTGFGREEERRPAAGEPSPDHVCDDLPAAVAWLLDGG